MEGGLARFCLQQLAAAAQVARLRVRRDERVVRVRVGAHSAAVHPVPRLARVLQRAWLKGRVGG